MKRPAGKVLEPRRTRTRRFRRTDRPVFALPPIVVLAIAPLLTTSARRQRDLKRPETDGLAFGSEAGRVLLFSSGGDDTQVFAAPPTEF